MAEQNAILLAKIAEQLGKAPVASYDSEGKLALLVLITKAYPHIPDEVWECSSLQELRLGGFELEHFPAEIAKLTQLRSLRIVSSRIGTFPSTMQALSQLEKLEGDRAHLEDITGLCRLPALCILRLKQCAVRQLPPEIGRLHRLEVLQLTQNQVSSFLPPWVSWSRYDRSHFTRTSDGTGLNPIAPLLVMTAYKSPYMQKDTMTSPTLAV